MYEHVYKQTKIIYYNLAYRQYNVIYRPKPKQWNILPNNITILLTDYSNNGTFYQTI